jgi:hypothetical protein
MVFMVVLLGFAALTIDVGVMYNTRADLQQAADAAALAAASSLASDAMMQVRMGADGSNMLAQIVNLSSTRADSLASMNPSFGTLTTIIESSDITRGWLDPADGTATLQTAVALDQYNAVQAVVRREAEGSNGPVTFLFAPIFGNLMGETAALATAIYDDRVGGFDVSSLPDGLLPFTIHEDMYEEYFADGDDEYGYDEDLELIYSGPDGIREINLYPHDMAPGNFGLLNIGTPNMGTPALRDHIENGVPPEDFEAEVGTTELLFFDDDADSLTYAITGTPGLTAELASSIETREEQIVGFFLHSFVGEQGSNVVYTITSLRFGRVMDVNLTGGPTQQGFWIQPASYSGSGVLLSENAPSSNGLLGRIVLAR